MRIPYIFILLFLLISCNSEDKEFTAIDPLPDQITNAQQELISVLSGNKKLSNIDYTINSRATLEERKISRLYLTEIFSQINLDAIEHHYREANTNPLINFMVPPFKGTNLYAKIPSTAKSDEYIVLGAHYDTARNCPGANDNATAIALLFGITKQLQGLTKRYKNVIIVLFDQEEEGLVGSRAFAKYLKTNNYNVHSVHTIDQMGWDEDSDRAIELELPTEALKKIYEAEAKKLNIPLHITSVNSTDHHSFRELGYNALGVTEEYVNGDTSPFKDTPKDTFDTVNFNYLESTTNLVFEVVKQIILEK